MKNGNLGVHTSHCCIWHGCKYGDEDCPVALGRARQEHVCQVCSEDYGLQTLDEMHKRLRIDKMPDELKLEAIQIGRLELLFRGELCGFTEDDQLMIDYLDHLVEGIKGEDFEVDD